MLNLRRNNRGETIIEVMISMAIVAAVLSASYATASRALRTGRQAQERSEALRYVESEIEMLKVMAKGKPQGTAPFVNNAVFCFNTSATGLTTVTTSDAESNLSTRPAGCRRNELYNISVKYEQDTPGRGAANPNDRFTVRADWERLGGGQDNIVMLYKIHPGLD